MSTNAFHDDEENRSRPLNAVPEERVSLIRREAIAVKVRQVVVMGHMSNHNSLSHGSLVSKRLSTKAMLCN
jgi:hypothetical protein